MVQLVGALHRLERLLDHLPDRAVHGVDNTPAHVLDALVHRTQVVQLVSQGRFLEISLSLFTTFVYNFARILNADGAMMER